MSDAQRVAQGQQQDEQRGEALVAVDEQGLAELVTLHEVARHQGAEQIRRLVRGERGRKHLADQSVGTAVRPLERRRHIDDLAGKKVLKGHFPCAHG